MRIEDLAPMFETWDRLNLALNGFIVAQPADITRRAAALGKARAEMAVHDLPEAAQRAWTSLQQTIGAALVSAPHEMSASIERLKLRREAMHAAVLEMWRHHS